MSQQRDRREEELSGGEEQQSRPVPDPLFSRGMAVINLDTWLLGGISDNVCECVCVYTWACVCACVHRPFISDDISPPSYCMLPLRWLFALVSEQGT